MNKLYPFLFNLDGMTQSYLWGGEKLYNLVPTHESGIPLAEIWAISDRPTDNRISIISNGPLAGKSLHDLIIENPTELLGQAQLINGNFPLLVKLLDAKEQLSLQVHPSVPDTGGESKTECWLLLDGTDSNASIIAGFNKTTSNNDFSAAITNSNLEPIVHSIPVKTGDAMFLPSGRLHAIGAGCLILEIQENSNTTYRVFDWNRIDPATNQPRQLQIEDALASIDFNDRQPQLQQPKPLPNPLGETLIECPQFILERWQVQNENIHQLNNSFEIITCLNGELSITGNGETIELKTLSTSLIPASVTSYQVSGNGSYSRVYVPSKV